MDLHRQNAVVRFQSQVRGQSGVHVSPACGAQGPVAAKRLGAVGIEVGQTQIGRPAGGNPKQSVGAQRQTAPAELPGQLPGRHIGLPFPGIHENEIVAPAAHFVEAPFRR